MIITQAHQKKFLASILIVLLIANLILFGLGKINVWFFWIIIAIIFIAVKFGFKKIKKQ